MSKQAAPKFGKSFSIVFFRDGGLIASIGTKVNLWTDFGLKRLAMASPFQNPAYLDLSPNGNALVVKNTRGQIALLSSQTLELQGIFPAATGEGCQVLYSACGRYLVEGSWSGQLTVRDAISGKVSYTEHFPNTMVRWLSPSIDRSALLYVLQPKGLNDAPSGPSLVFIRSWPFDSNDPQIIEGNWRCVYAAALSPNSKSVAVLHLTEAGTLRVDVVDTTNRQTRHSSEFAYGGTNLSIAWSPNGKYLACVQKDQVVAMDSETLEVVVTRETPYPCFVGFSPKGENLAVGSWTQGTLVPTDSWRNSCLPNQP